MTTPPDLPTRLREAADDITFTGRPDPHDDKALLREAAERIESLEFDATGHARAMLGVQEQATIAADPLRFLAEIEKAWRRRHADLGFHGHYDGPAPQAVHEMFQRMMENERGLQAERAVLARFILDNFADEGVAVVKDGVRLVNGRKLDDAALLKLEPGRDPEPGETVAKMAIDRLQLALDRGAFASDWSELDSLRTSVAAQREHHHELGQHIVAIHKPGEVDTEAVAILDGYHVGAKEVAGGGAGEPGEHTLAAALRLLKLAHTRGAFGPGDHMLLTPPGPLGTLLLEMMSDPAIDMGVFPLDSDGHRRLEGEGGVEMAVRLLREAWQGGAFSCAVTPVDLSDAAAEVKAFNADENTLNARKLVTALAGEFSALASALDRDGLVPAADPQVLKIQEAIEGLDQLTRDMQPGEDGPVTARGEPLDGEPDETPSHLAPEDEDGPDLLELGERARTTGRNLRLMMGDEPTVKHALLATAAAVLEDVADALAPVDEGSAA
jgi:hypothetical protein